MIWPVGSTRSVANGPAIIRARSSHELGASESVFRTALRLSMSLRLPQAGQASTIPPAGLSRFRAKVGDGMPGAPRGMRRSREPSLVVQAAIEKGGVGPSEATTHLPPRNHFSVNFWFGPGGLGSQKNAVGACPSATVRLRQFGP